MFFDNLRKVKQEAKRLAVAVVIVEMLLVAGYAIGEQYNLFDVFRQSNTITIVQARRIEQPKEETQADRIGELAADIWNRESTRGKNNFSKCAAKNKINGIGYGIDGTGKYLCFSNHAEEMEVLRGWLIAKLAAGYTEREALCIYSGNHYKECNQ